MQVIRQEDGRQAHILCVIFKPLNNTDLDKRWERTKERGFWGRISFSLQHGADKNHGEVRALQAGLCQKQKSDYKDEPKYTLQFRA